MNKDRAELAMLVLLWCISFMRHWGIECLFLVISDCAGTVFELGFMRV